MFEVKPAGSFALTLNPAMQPYASEALVSIAAEVKRATASFKPLGMILSGSMARGEATILADPTRGPRWLSDIECLVVFPEERSREITGIDRTLRAAEASRNDNPGGRACGIKLELRSVLPSRLRSLRPAIFNAEFVENGKLLWGDPAAIPLPIWAGTNRIPRADAFRLLNNRVIEQVEARLAHDRDPTDILRLSYVLTKFWIDIGTSLSIFLDCYQTSYRKRQASIEDALKAHPDLLGPGISEKLTQRIGEAMSAKRGDQQLSLGDLSASLDEAANVGSRIWEWESAQMLNIASTGNLGYGEVPPRLRQLESGSQRFRDWARLVARTRKLPSYAPRAVLTLLRFGSLANAIYGAGNMICFYWHQLSSDAPPGDKVFKLLSQLWSIHGSADTDLRRRLAQATLDAWESHVRFAPV